MIIIQTLNDKDECHFYRIRHRRRLCHRRAAAVTCVFSRLTIHDRPGMPLAMAGGMKKILLTAISIFGLMTAGPLSAQHGGGSPKPPKPVKTTQGASAPKTTTHVAAPHKTTPGGGHAIKTTTALKAATPKAVKAPKTTKTTTEPKAA